MSHFIYTRFAPTEGCDVRAYLGGSEDDIPCVDFGFDPKWHDSPAISIHLGNTDEPAEWLRTAAARMLELADKIEATS